tara:strand:- start:37 stop:372 length:336 start_codon:yes stop_codon:yes gene_type:complete
MKLQEFKNEWNELSYKKSLSGAEALEAVKQDGYALQFVNVQTDEICLEAVKEDGYALRFVNAQTEEICLEAVKQNSYALQFVSEDMFEDEAVEITMDEIIAKFGCNVKIVK